MNAVNEGDSPVRAFTSRRYARVLVTSTSSKPCIIGLWWVERIASSKKRLALGYGITWSSLCCFIVSSFLPSPDPTCFLRGGRLRGLDSANPQTLVDANWTLESLRRGREVRLALSMGTISGWSTG